MRCCDEIIEFPFLAFSDVIKGVVCFWGVGKPLVGDPVQVAATRMVGRAKGTGLPSLAAGGCSPYDLEGWLLEEEVANLNGHDRAQ